MKIQGFRGNCDSKGKLGMCPSLAEPDSGGFSRNSVCNYEPQAKIFPCSSETGENEILFTRNNALRENNLQHPAKGGSTPAFACQRAAIAPLPCLNLQLVS